jgi:hypothetical protein
MVSGLDWGFTFSVALRVFFNLLAFFGIALIIYELIATFAKDRWMWLDEFASKVSPFLTMCGTFLTILLSVYYYSVPSTPPEVVTVYISAPLIMCACAIAIICLVVKRSIPHNIVNAFAIIAIAAALLRFQPNPIKDRRYFWTGSDLTPIQRCQDKKGSPEPQL